MAKHQVDKGSDFIESGMTLISEIYSEKYFKMIEADKKIQSKYQVPYDRYSRPCGGVKGFDDFVERWHE